MNGTAYRLTSRTPGRWGPPESTVPTPPTNMPEDLEARPARSGRPDRRDNPIVGGGGSPRPTPFTSTADWWLGTLAMTVGAHLDGRVGQAELRREYDRFLRSPIVTGDDELRAILPPSQRRER